MRLIDADWVRSHVKPYEPSDEEWSVTGGTAVRLIHNAIDYAPTVDAVSVTRCKDCKYYSIRAYGRVVCWCNRHDIVVEDADFCSRGELKEDDDCETDRC